MADLDDPGRAPTARHAGWRFVAITLAMPSVSASMGVDGGQVFQILAVEDLHLDPRAIGIAFGLGVVSIPFQVLAARLPLSRARRNLQLFLLLAGAHCLVLALLVGNGATGTWADVALAVTVTAELIVSLLYAPSWQPLLSHALTTEARQGLNARWRAVGSLAVAGLLVVFGGAERPLRTVLLCLVGLVAMALAAVAQRLPDPSSAAPRPAGGPDARRRAPLAPGMRWVFLTVALVGPASWPLFIVYSREALWPDGNLGVLGAVQFAGSLLAALTWRPTAGRVGARAVRAAVGLVVCSLALLAVPAPVDGPREAATVMVALGLASACRSVVLIAMLESVHRLAGPGLAVRALTILDVIGSSCLQAALLGAGFVITASADHPGWPVDPYRLSLAVAAVALLATVGIARRHA